MSPQRRMAYRRREGFLNTPLDFLERDCVMQEQVNPSLTPLPMRGYRPARDKPHTLAITSIHSLSQPQTDATRRCLEEGCVRWQWHLRKSVSRHTFLEENPSRKTSSHSNWRVNT